MKPWCPFAVRNRAPRGLWVTPTTNVKVGVLHTTESYGFTPRDDSYFGHTSYPHFTIVLEGKKVIVYQHIPLTHAARALRNKSGGVQTNSNGVIQIEVCWKAADAYRMPRKLLRGVRELMAWIEEQTGIPPTAAPQGFHDGRTRAWLAREDNGIRFSDTKWNQFRGWCGHQHVPENTHWDPGAINIKFLLSPTYRTIRRLRQRVRNLRRRLREAQ